MAKKGGRTKKPRKQPRQRSKLLRVCHKFLVDEDGYDLGMQEIVRALSPEYETYVTTFITKTGLKEYANKNNLIRKNGYYHHKQTGAFVVPIFYKKQHGIYINDLFLKENIQSFKKQYDNIFARVHPDIVHVHGTLTPQFLYAAKMARSLGKKVFATHHIGLINQHHHNQSLWILLRKWMIHNRFPFVCDKVICLSRHGRRSFLSRRNVAVSHGIGNITAKEIGQAEMNRLLKKNLLSRKDAEIGNHFIIYPARFCRQKNQKALIEAFAEYGLGDAGIKLLLIGQAKDKQYTDSLKNRIIELGMSDRIYLIGEISHAKLLSMMNKADLLVSPSINEGLGRTSLEALQLGVPVLTSNDSGHREYVEEGVNGHMFNPHSRKSIVNAMRKSIKLKRLTPGNLDERGKKNIEMMKRHYT